MRRTLRKHDTPASPHREHDPRAGGGHGSEDYEGLTSFRDKDIEGIRREAKLGPEVHEHQVTMVGTMSEMVHAGWDPQEAFDVVTEDENFHGGTDVTRQARRVMAAGLSRLVGQNIEGDPNSSWGSLPSADPEQAAQEWGSLPGGGYRGVAPNEQEFEGNSSLKRAVAENTLAVLDLVEAVEQPAYFKDGDEVVPTGDPAEPLGKRPPAKGVDTPKSVFPETEDPEGDDEVAHIAYPDSVEEGPFYKRPARKAQPSEDIPSSKACQILEDGEVHGEPLTEAQRGMFGAACGRSKKAATVLRGMEQVYASTTGIAKLLRKGSIAEDITETMDDLTGALHELKELEGALTEFEDRQQAAQEAEQAEELALQRERKVAAAAARR